MRHKVKGHGAAVRHGQAAQLRQQLRHEALAVEGHIAPRLQDAGCGAVGRGEVDLLTYGALLQPQ